MVSTCAIKKNVADPPSRNDLSSSFFLNATNVSDSAAAILTELVSRIAKDGEKGFASNQIAKKNQTQLNLVNGFSE